MRDTKDMGGMRRLTLDFLTGNQETEEDERLESNDR